MSGTERYIEEIHPTGTFDKPIDPNLPKILYVDSDQGEIDYVLDLLRNDGYEISGLTVDKDVYDSSKIQEMECQLVKKVGSSDIAILHYSLGTIDSRNVLERIPEKVRIIVVTGASYDSSKYQELQNAGYEVVQKPIKNIQKILKV
jgi:DNA-binding response OmpR family regulator